MLFDSLKGAAAQVLKMSPILDARTYCKNKRQVFIFNERYSLRTWPVNLNSQSPQGTICPQSTLFCFYHHRARVWNRVCQHPGTIPGCCPRLLPTPAWCNLEILVLGRAGRRQWMQKNIPANSKYWRLLQPALYHWAQSLAHSWGSTNAHWANGSNFSVTRIYICKTPT